MALTTEDLVCIQNLIYQNITREIRIIKIDKAEFNELKNIVKELAQAQARTEQRVEELIQAQARTEQRVEELAQAQAKTEKMLRSLIHEFKEFKTETRTHLGGLSNTIGYGLEDKAMKFLPVLLKRDFEIQVQGRLIRDFIEYKSGREDEVNIYGKALKGDKEIIIIGEAESQLSKGLIDDLIKLKKRVERELQKEVIPLAITYLVKPAVKKYAQDAGIKIYYSYDFTD